MANEAADPALDEFLGVPRRGWWSRWGKWVAVGIGFLLIALTVARCASGGKKTEYLTGQVQRGDIAITVSATGNLSPTKQVDVGSEISGIVERVMVDVNDRVTKGQPVALIDTSRLEDAVTRSQAALGANQALVAQARATVAESRAQLSRLRDVYRLSGGRVPSQTEMATAEANVARAVASLRSNQANVVSAQAQLSSDRTQVGKAEIRSPVAGVVLKRSIDPGQTVAASFSTPSLFIIAEDLTQMKLEVAVDEADVGSVHEGLPASFTVDAYPGRVFPAQISRVNLGAKNLVGGSSATSASASTVVSYVAVLTLSNADLTLRPGMTATATIQTAGAKNVLIVPNAALRFTPATDTKAKTSALQIGPPDARKGKVQQRGIGAGSHQLVYVLDTANKLRPVEVVTGQSDGRTTAVTGPLKPGDTVVTGIKATSTSG